MTVEEASSKILQTDPTSRESMEEGRSGKGLQRKCLPFTSPVIPLYYCIIIIMVLTTIVMVLSTFLAVRNTKPVSYVLYVTCPKEWIGFGSKCFYFSEDARNWTFSKTFCTSLEAVLAQFETEEELNFLKRYKGPSDHWLGLRRESSKHVWKWTDSTDYNASFAIKGVGECAYLNDIGLSSARNYTHRNWICSKTNNNVSTDLNTLRTF
ncbi:C-type lectin domain family 2 member D [Balaenoptera acutorostrata]|uniref:C-type lectin domain family 2 member D n=1 Tax=Balaenoptera acutorostrata TaxID=9767 RepID=A0A384B920_BALAC|nr:C-type lectin domain family 2 member D [Balaenoptera acutorostrata]XP_007196168.1 C-type lectin domain family 2 member D [Balaenoptera acutorostrata]XP_028018140.1 C-type lectin domain family 2 member D [Balaenoptera acutorostrata]